MSAASGWVKAARQAAAAAAAATTTTTTSKKHHQKMAGAGTAAAAAAAAAANIRSIVSSHVSSLLLQFVSLNFSSAHFRFRFRFDISRKSSSLLSKATPCYRSFLLNHVPHQVRAESPLDSVYLDLLPEDAEVALGVGSVVVDCRRKLTLKRQNKTKNEKQKQKQTKKAD